MRASAAPIRRAICRSIPACAEAIVKRDEVAAAQAKLAKVFSDSEQREVRKLAADAAAAFQSRRWPQARDGFAAALAAWARLEKEAAERIRAAEERARQLDAAKRAYAVYAQRVPLDGGGYTMDHTASVFLMGRSGEFVTTLDAHEDEPTSLAKLRRLIRG